MNNIERHQLFLNVGQNAVNQSTQIAESGFNYFNFLASGGGIVPVDTGIDIESFRKLSRVIFKSDFDIGLDTYRTWNGFFDFSTMAPSSNASAIDGNNQVGPAEVAKNRIPLFAEPQTITDNRSYFRLGSKNIPRFNPTQSCFIYFQGLFENEDATANVQTYSIIVTQNSDDIEVEQENWNIDTLDGSQGAGNPSGIEILFSKIQTFIIYIPSKDTGDIKFGFLINNEIQFVHEHKINNSGDYDKTPPWGNLNLPIRVSGEKSGSNVFSHEYGLFGITNGIKFVSKMLTNMEPAIVIKKYLHSVFAYTYGGVQNNDLYRPFSKGTDETLKTVLAATEIPLVTIRNKMLFNGHTNTVGYSLRALEFFNKGANLQAGCLFRVRYDSGLSADSWVNVNNSSSVEFDISATGLTGTSFILYEKVVFPNNSFEINFTDDDMINNVVNEICLGFLTGKSNISASFRPYLTITAEPILGIASVDVGATFRWVEKY